MLSVFHMLMDCHLAIIFFCFSFFNLIYYMLCFYIVLNLPELVGVVQHSNKIKNITVFSGILLQTRTVVQGFLKLRGNYPRGNYPRELFGHILGIIEQIVIACL